MGQISFKKIIRGESLKLLLVLIFFLSSIFRLEAQSYFPTPKFGTPTMNEPDPSISLYNNFKNEIVDQSSLDLNIINADVTIPGRGLITLSVERCYSSRDLFKNKRTDAVISNYVNLLYDFHENFSYHTKKRLESLTGREFDDILNDTAIRTECIDSLKKQNEIFSFEHFINNSEEPFGDGWGLLINGFSKIYILDSYISRMNEDYKVDDPGDEPPFLGTWRHDCYIFSSQGIMDYYKEQEYNLSSDIPVPVANGQYTADIDSKNFIFSYDETEDQYELKTKNGLKYTFSLIKSGIYDHIYYFSDGVIKHEGHKKIAYLKQIEDKYGNILNIDYDTPSNPYRIKSVTLKGIPAKGFADRTVNIIYDPGTGYITEIQYPGDTGTRSWTYSYTGDKLTSAIDPLQPTGRITQYDYISDAASYHNGILNKIIYPNDSYTIYEYDRAILNYNTALDAITDMLLPYSKRVVKKRIRYDIDPSDGSEKNNITTLFYRTVTYNGIDNDNDDLIDEFEYLGARIVIADEIYPPVGLKDFRDTVYEYNSDNLVANVTAVIEFDRLYKQIQYSYSGNNPYPIKVEEKIIPEAGTPVLMRRVENTYDSYYNVNTEEVFLSDNATPEVINNYDYEYDTTTQPGFILNYLKQKVTTDSGGTVLRKSRGKFDSSYKDLIESYQMLDGTDILMLKYNYDPVNPWQIDSIEQKLDDARWITTTFEYDTEKGIFITKKLQTVNGIDLENRFEYNIESGTLKKITDENNNMTEITAYDTLNRISEKRFPSGMIENYFYDDINSKITITISDGVDNINTTIEDNNGYGGIEEKKVIDHTQSPEQIYTKNYEYYKTGPLRKEIVSKGDSKYQRINRYWYDMLGRVIRVEPPNNSEIFYEYRYDLTEKTEVNKIRNQLGQEDIYYKDFLGRLVKVEKRNSSAPEIYQTQYFYDPLGNLSEIWQNANDADVNKILKTYYGYDNFGRNIWVKYPYDAPDISETYQYTYHGKLKKKINKQGNETIHYFDDIGRLASIDYPNPALTGNITFEYDNGTYAKGKLTRVISSKSGHIEYEYAQYNRLHKLKQYILPLDRTYEIEYNYDIVGNITSMKIPDNVSFKQINYLYDGGSKLLNVEYNGTILAEYKYDKLNNMIEKYYNDGKLKTEYKYDSGSRVKEILSYNIDNPEKKIFKEKYIYDPIGNRKSTIDVKNIWTSYEYDSILNMLTKVKYGTEKDTTFEYNKLFNRTKINYAYGSHDYVYQNNSHRLDHSILNSNPNTTVELMYDYRGNTIREQFKNLQNKKIDNVEKEKVYVWDDENRLVRFEKHIITENNVPSLNLTANYLYNPNGMRIMKEVQSSSGTYRKYYLYNANQVIAELDEAGNIKDTFIYGLSRICKIDESGNIIYFFYDILGSTRKITDPTGEILQTYKYGPYGNIESSKGKVYNAYRYNGKEFDTESGLYYYGARYYNSKEGRFINKDPLSFATYNSLFLNPYIYCYNRPLTYIDPTGKFGVVVGGILGGIFGTIGGGLWGGLIAELSGEDFWEGAKVGAIAGAAFGTIYGGVTGYGGVYSGLSGVGNMFIDLTWSLPNTAVGFTLGWINYGIGYPLGEAGAVQEAGIEFVKGKGILFKGGPLGSLWELLGFGGFQMGTSTFINMDAYPGITYGSSMHDYANFFRHEYTHLLQQRIFGPLFFPLYLSNYFINIPLEFNFKDAYNNILFELWAKGQEIPLSP